MTEEIKNGKEPQPRLVSVAEAAFLGAVKTFQDMGFSNEEIAEVFGIKPKSIETKQKESTLDTKSS
jgi:hypothetical protein